LCAEKTIFEILTSDGGVSLMYDGNGGDNSFERVAIGKPAVKQITVNLLGSGAITDIQFEPSKCTLKKVVDFSTYKSGDAITTIGAGITVGAVNENNVVVAAMIFNTAVPTGGDIDLGTPNQSFGGPGIGNAGKKGKLFANKVAKGNALIITEDGVASNPDDNAKGGTITFTFPKPYVYVDSIGLLDNDEGTSFTVYTSDGGITQIVDGNGGDNSFELVKIGKPGVTKIVVLSNGSGAITEINSCA
jgi:hypothetical protein